MFSMKKRVIVLGATGSIGTSAAEIFREHPSLFEPVAFAALKSKGKCESLAKEFSAKAYVGPSAALDAVRENEADICLVALVGESGIEPTIAAIKKRMHIALATKEVLVMAGETVMGLAKEYEVKMLPVDSEHSAIFQCIQGSNCVERIILTASGGPFLNGPEDLSSVTPQQALDHPRWKMGPKVTIDSSTMMNKGFEIIEAYWLFGIPVEKIDVVIHPESIVHSLVEFSDGATLAQLSPPDMKVAIQYALTWPDRVASKRQKLDLASLGRLTFLKPDAKRFPALELVKKAISLGGDRCARLARADERAVARFLAGEISYTDIIKECERALC
jgi:1-deoxy-D-xylulose-5-phosphate reductoisomerase